MSDPSDVTDVTQPQQATNKARFAADEIRQIKAYIQNLVLGILPNVPNPVRQIVSKASFNPLTGQPSYIVAGAGLAVSILATAVSVIMNSANGFGINGAIDTNSSIGVDNIAAWTVPPSNTSYLSYDILTQNTGTYTQTLAPYQESTIYNQGAQGLNHFNGVVGAGISLDDFGNTCTLNGGAKLVNNYLPLATSASSLGGTGAGGALDGATQYASYANFISLGPNGWTLRCKTKPLNALPGAGNTARIFSTGTISGGSFFGVEFGIFNNAGTIKFVYDLSSTGNTNDIAANVVGTTTPVLGTAYDLEVTYDALAGVYRMYVNGIQEVSTASALRICRLQGLTIGSSNGAASTFYQGCIGEWEFLPYCAHPNGTAFAVPTVASNVATQGYSSDWMSIVDMKMYQVSGPSLVAGQPPAFTRVARVYHGEADSNGGAITAVRIRPLNGSARFIGTPLAVGLGGLQVFQHNLGSTDIKERVDYECVTTEIGYNPGDMLGHRIEQYSTEYGYVTHKTKNILNFRVCTGGIGAAPNVTTNGTTLLTANHWRPVIDLYRGWGGAY